MIYVDVLPTIPGWYWVRSRRLMGGKAVVQVTEWRSEFYVGITPIKEFVDNLRSCQWAGPIPEPGKEVPSEEVNRLLRLVADIDQTLRVPAAEYVPAISDVFNLIDRYHREGKR